MSNITDIPATGEHSKLINFIYKKAERMMKDGPSKVKFAGVGAILNKKEVEDETRL